MPRRGENIYRRKDNRWEGRYIKERDNDNKPKYGYVYAHSYREVKSKLEKAKLTISNTSYPPQNVQDILFKTIAEEWFEYIQPQIKESTNIKYYNLLNMYLLPALGEQPIKQITNAQLEKLCHELLTSAGKKNTGLSAKTVTDVLSLIRNIFKFASQKGIVFLCDANSVKIKQNSKEMHIFSTTEQEKLYQYLCSNLNNYNVGILLCLFTGIRIGEVCALRWEDISIQEKTIHIHQTMQRIQSRNENKKTKVIISTPKSQCSVRIIPLPDNLVEIIAQCTVEKKRLFFNWKR